MISRVTLILDCMNRRSLDYLTNVMATTMKKKFLYPFISQMQKNRIRCPI